MTPRTACTALFGALIPVSIVGCGDVSTDAGEPVSAGGDPITVVSDDALESGMPALAEHAGVLLLSHLERRSDQRWALRVTELSADAGVLSATDVAVRDDFFVNWADFPSVTPWGPDGGAWLAHWLQRGPEGGYDYGVRLTTSVDRGRSWSAPWTPHEDGTPTEHGFVSVLPSADAFELVWLDGRRYASGDERMQFRGRLGGAAGPLGEERIVDDLVCDCCQTDVAPTPGGAVAVYRDRTEGEIRDIHAARWVRATGEWILLGPVHEDGWEIGGCPVNGPAVAADGNATAVAWFTAAGDRPAVHVAVGGPDGGDFGAPVRVDRGEPVGRVDVRFGPSGDPWVLWMEALPEGRAELLLARIDRARVDGARGDGEWTSDTPLRVAELGAARGTGFPRFVFLPGGDALVAWTDLGEDARRLRLLRFPVQ